MVDVRTGPAVAEGTGDLLVVPVMTDLAWGPGADWAAERLGDWLEPHLAGREFTGKANQVAVVPSAGALPYGSVAFVGLGDEVDAEALRRAAANAAKAAGAYQTVVTTLHQVDTPRATDLVTFGFLLGRYRFDRYLSEPKPSTLETLVLAGATETGERGAVIAEAVARARDLVNEPAGYKSPARLATWASDELGAVGAEVEVWDEKRIAAEGLGGLMGVAAGSHQPPRLVQARYRPDGAQVKLAFVGKGIVFDSGGLSIKPAAGMETMKTDMSGAAAVLNAVWAIARLGLPVEVLAITPLTENMPGGGAIKPGDVFTARNGKTVEVLNTDAEGRLVLADGLSLAVEADPALIVDVATLTGACMVALGKGVAGLFASDDDVAARVEAAAKDAGESVWRLPMETSYRQKLESEVADIKNIGDRFGGAITAALFLKEFAGDAPWAHLDIAGPARAESAEHYLTKGGTGFAVRTLVALAEGASSEG
jgi:leucyl aminopeptidase